MRLGVVRPDLQRAPVTGGGLVEPTHILEDVAEVVVRLDVIRLERQRAAVAGGGLVQPSQIMQRAAQVVLHLFVVRQQRRSFLQRGQRIRASPQLIGRRAQYLPAEPEARKAFRHRPRQKLGFHVTLLVEERHQSTDLLVAGRPLRSVLVWCSLGLECRGCFRIIGTTLLVFFPAAARAGVVSSGFHTRYPCLLSTPKGASKTCCAA